MKITYPTWFLQQFFDDNGNPLSLGKVRAYNANTGLEAVTYNGNQSANPFPIILDSSGRCELLIDNSFAYKFVVTDRFDLNPREYDHVFGAETSDGGEGTTNHNELFNRDMPSQHPISAITGLQGTLDDKADATSLLDYVSKTTTSKQTIKSPLELSASKVRILSNIQANTTAYQSISYESNSANIEAQASGVSSLLNYGSSNQSQISNTVTSTEAKTLLIARLYGFTNELIDEVNGTYSERSQTSPNGYRTLKSYLSNAIGSVELLDSVNSSVVRLNNEDGNDYVLVEDTTGSAKLTPTDLTFADVSIFDTFADATHASTHASGGSDEITIAQSQVTGLVTALSGKSSLGANSFTDTQVISKDVTDLYLDTNPAFTPLGVLALDSRNDSAVTGTASYNRLIAKNSTRAAMGYHGIVSGSAYANDFLFWGLRSASAEYREYLRLSSSALTSKVKVVTPASTTSASSLNKPHGTAPTTPANGDEWTTTAGTFTRINGVTEQLTPVGYGEIHVHDSSTAQSIANGTTYVLLTNWTDNGVSLYTTPDAVTNKRITVAKAGVYQVTYNCSMTCGTNNTTILATAFKNGTTELDNLHFSRKIGTGADVGSAGFSGLVSLNANDYIDVRVRHDQISAVNFTQTYANLSVQRVG